MITPCHESSPTHLHLPKPCMRKQSFSKQNLLFSKIYYRSVGKNMGLPSEANWLVSFPKLSWSSSEMICWPISQPNSLEYHPVKFLSQPCPFLQKSCHALTPTSRLPRAYENALCHFQNHLYNMSICIFSINYNYTHVIQ